MNTECLVCAGVTSGVWLCAQHHRHLAGLLDRTPGLAQDLETTTARLDRVTTIAGMHGKGGAQPAVVNFDAAEVLATLRRALLKWTHHLYRAHATVPASFTIPDMARHLRHHLPTMLPTQDVGFLYTELEDVTRTGLRTVDLPPDRDGWDYAGPCGAVFDNGTCGHQLWAAHHQTSTTCPRCGTTWDVTVRRSGALAAAVDLHATADTISRALTAAGQTVTPGNIHTWRHRGRLTPVGTDAAGRPTYRLGDVMRLLEGGV